MKNNQNIQTVHGVTHPVVADQPAEGSAESSTKLYRDETAKRLAEHNKKSAAGDQPGTNEGN